MMEYMIYTINPVESPFFMGCRYGRFEFRKRCGSMRAQRRRKAKPIRFTAGWGAQKQHIYEWQRDALFSTNCGQTEIIRV